MSDEEFAGLQPGDFVYDQSNQDWIVMQRDFNGTVVVAQTATIIAPAQWTLTPVPERDNELG